MAAIDHIPRCIPVFTADGLAILVDIMALHLAIGVVVNHLPVKKSVHQRALALLLAIGEKRNQLPVLPARVVLRLEHQLPIGVMRNRLALERLARIRRVSEALAGLE